MAGGPETLQRRAGILTALLSGGLSGEQAARELRLSTRQVRRLMRRYRAEGVAALRHGNRGRQPVSRLSDELRARIAELAATTYAGTPHLRLCELLEQREGIRVSRSTLRRILFERGIPTPRLRRRRLPAGMMPVAFDLAHHRVTLLDLCGADYREPFFHLTIERARRERPNLLSLELDQEAFLEAARLEPGRQPDGFIFHVGRCGSTLLANMLSAPDEHLVVKESTAVNTLMNGLVTAADEQQLSEREALMTAALPFMFRPSRGAERRLLFKFTSWNCRLAASLMRLFPRSPAVFLYRSAFQTVGSMVAEPSGWGNLLTRPRAIQARYFPSLAELATEQPISAAGFYAHSWRSAVEAALSLPAERVLVVDYGDLTGRSSAVLGRVLEHFGLEASPETIAWMSNVQTVYSKDPAGRAGFEPQGAHRRPPLDPAQEADVRAVVGDLPGRLAERRLVLA